MSNIISITREEFDQALKRLSRPDLVCELSQLYKDAPPELRKAIEPPLLDSLRGWSALLDQEGNFSTKVMESAVGDFLGINELLKMENLPDEIFVEAAIFSAADSVEFAVGYVSREGLSKADRKRIAKACRFGMELDADGGYSNRIVKLFADQDLTSEEKEEICNAVEKGWENETRDFDNYVIIGEVLIFPHAPLELREKALAGCVKEGAFIYVLETLRNEDNPESLRAMAKEGLIDSLVNVGYYACTDKAKILIKVSKEEESLPEEVRGLIGPTLKDLLRRTHDHDKDEIASFFRELDAQDVKGISLGAKAALDEAADWIQLEEKDRPFPSGLEIVKRYIRQVKDESVSGLMEPTKKPAEKKPGQREKKTVR